MPPTDPPDTAPRLVAAPLCFLPAGMVPPDSGALPLSGLTVLLVEDSRFASDAMRLMCQRSGARLRRAATVAQARAHLKTYRPDVVIVDLGLPDGCGDALIREVCLQRLGAVVLGTSGDPLGRAAALAAGALGFLDKPVAGLVAFQRAVLRHLPDRSPVSAMGFEGEGIIPDPMALQDDLAHAADLLAHDADGAQLRYLAGFLGGIARAAGDGALAEGAQALAHRPGALPPLRLMVDARLASGRAL